MMHQGDHRQFEIALRADREAPIKAPAPRKETTPRPCRLEGRLYE